jgi:hypothetical protein
MLSMNLRFQSRPVLTSSAGVALALLLQTPSARADDPAACITAHANGQEEFQKGALTSARASFAICSAAACPDVIRSDCTVFAREVESALPSVVFAVSSTSGGALGPASVRIDGSPEKRALDGGAVALDPGTHRFVFELADGRTQSVSVTLREREKSRRVEARFPDAAAATTFGSEPGFRVPVLTYVFGGVGVLAAGSFVYFALSGREAESRLDDCRPSCARDDHGEDADTMRTRYLAADISLGVSAISLGVGAFFLVDALSHRKPSDAQATRAPAAKPSLDLYASPEPGGFRLQAAGQF